MMRYCFDYTENGLTERKGMKEYMIKLFVLTGKEIWRKKYVYFLMSLELVLIAILFLLFSGKLEGAVKSYKICNAFEGKNAYYFGKYVFFEKDVENIASGVKIEKVPKFYYDLENAGECIAYGYDDYMMKICHYPMSEGIWFDQYEGTNIPVISLDKTIKCGEIISLSNGQKLEVIGYLDQDSYIINFHGMSSDGQGTLDQIVSHPDAQLIVPYQSSKFTEISKGNIEENFDTGNFILLIDNPAKEKKIVKKFKEYGRISSISVMEQNYKKDLRAEFIINGILLTVFFIVCVVGLIGYNEVRLEENRRRMKIYRLNGAKKMYFMISECMINIIILTVSFLLFLLAYDKMDIASFLNSQLAIVNRQQFVITLVALGGMIFLSSFPLVKRLYQEEGIKF